MTQEILSAEEWKKRLGRASHDRAREKRNHERQVAREALVADLRDDTISMIKNSRLSFQDIQDEGGPVVKTLQGWENKITRTPHTVTMRMALRVIGKDLGIIDYAPGKKNLGLQSSPRRK